MSHGVLRTIKADEHPCERRLGKAIVGHGLNSGLERRDRVGQPAEPEVACAQHHLSQMHVRRNGKTVLESDGGFGVTTDVIEESTEVVIGRARSGARRRIFW